MIWHDDPRVQFIMSEAHAMLNASQNLAGNLRLSEEGRSAARLIEETVHGGECLAGSCWFAPEDAMPRKAVMQPESDEQRLANDIQMREPAHRDRHVRIVAPRRAA